MWANKRIVFNSTILLFTGFPLSALEENDSRKYQTHLFKVFEKISKKKKLSKKLENKDYLLFLI